MRVLSEVPSQLLIIRAACVLPINDLPIGLRARLILFR